MKNQSVWKKRAGRESDLAWDSVGARNCFDGNTDGGKPAVTKPVGTESTHGCDGAALGSWRHHWMPAHAHLANFRGPGPRPRR